MLDLTAAPIIAWSDQLATGLASVDHQHRRLIDIISALGNLRTRCATAEEIAPVLAELHDYTVYHFQHEADLLQAWPINETYKAVHLKSHQSFIECIEKTGELIAANPSGVVDHLLSFLVKWLVHHITGEDARMAREILALRSGFPATQEGLAENPLHDALIDTVSDLYDSISRRTFETLALNHKLQTYYDQQEEENALAQDIILRLMNRGGLSSPQIHYWFAPTATFSGDIVAAMPGPEGQLYALIADATGHGLAAAITVLPALTVFHAMAEQGHGAAEILSEINRHLRATLPPGRFVAATLLHINETDCTAEAWNGGMPDLLLLGPDGRIAHKMNSRQLPLGILDFDVEASATTTIVWEPGSQFVMYSDGLVEAASQAGEMFGTGRLCEVLLAAPAARRMSAIQGALNSHIGATTPHDDISLMLIDCIKRPVADNPPA